MDIIPSSVCYGRYEDFTEFLFQQKTCWRSLFFLWISVLMIWMLVMHISFAFVCDLPRLSVIYFSVILNNLYYRSEKKKWKTNVGCKKISLDRASAAQWIRAANCTSIGEMYCTGWRRIESKNKIMVILIIITIIIPRTRYMSSQSIYIVKRVLKWTKIKFTL